MKTVKLTFMSLLLLGCTEESEVPIIRNENQLLIAQFEPSPIVIEDFSLNEPHVSITKNENGQLQFNIVVFIKQNEEIYYNEVDEGSWVNGIIDFDLSTTPVNNWSRVENPKRIPLAIDNTDMIIFSILATTKIEKPRLKIHFLEPGSRINHVDGTVHLPHDSESDDPSGD
ncbi:MAG: hypothetical protein RIC35_13020 [Marinoscillum sp.]